jgi:hypothetical protein
MILRGGHPIQNPLNLRCIWVVNCSASTPAVSRHVNMLDSLLRISFSLWQSPVVCLVQLIHHHLPPFLLQAHPKHPSHPTLLSASPPSPLPCLSSLPNYPLAQTSLSLVCTTALHSFANTLITAFFLSSCFFSVRRQARWIVIAARGLLDGGRRREARKEREERVKVWSKILAAWGLGEGMKRDAG